MTNNFTFGIARDCSLAECQVQLLDKDQPVTLKYVNPAQVRLNIRNGQLVMVDVSGSEPQLIYRWHRFRVAQVNENQVLVDDFHGQLLEVGCPVGLQITPQEGDWVFVTMGAYAEQPEIADIESGDRPAHPAYLMEEVGPRVIRFFQHKASN